MGGGVFAEFQQPTFITTQNITGEWDYEADCLLIMFTASNSKHALIADLDSQDLYFSSGINYWQARTWSTIGWSATLTSKSFNISSSAPLTDVSFVPIVGKPTGYFT